jgi:outer membrane protein OmpA-like peptidoglycan-associated protein
MATALSNLPPEEQLRQLLWREELRRLDHLEDRVGDDLALKASVVPIIADVLSDAGIRDHRRVAAALAPLIVAGMRAEIRNSRDMMVDALYPITGRLVAAAVRNALKDLVDQLNDKLDAALSARRWRVRAKARLTGRSPAEILLQEGAAFDLIDLLLIDRQTGLLLARANPDASEELDDQLLGGLLTAIMGFVRSAMAEAREQELRTLEVGALSLHLQASQSVILAVKTRGPAPAGFEGALGTLFRDLLGEWGARLADAEALAPADRIALGEELASRFRALLEAKRRSFRRRSRKGTILLVVLALAALAWLGSAAWQRWQAGRIEAQAQAVIAAEPALAGYPLAATYDPAAGRLAVAGLVPDEAARTRLEQGLRAALPGDALNLRLAALAQPQDDALRQRVEAVGEAARAIEAALARERAAAGDALAAQGTALEQRLAAQTAALRAALATAEQAWSAALGAQAQSLEQQLAELRAALDRMDARLPTLAELRTARLEQWLAGQAIRFGQDTDLLEPEAARLVLVDLALRLAQAEPGQRLLIVGYADDTGDETLNRQVSLARAELVAAELRALGAIPQRLVVTGRSNERRVSSATGPGSPNRRVEFELLAGG